MKVYRKPLKQALQALMARFRIQIAVSGMPLYSAFIRPSAGSESFNNGFEVAIFLFRKGCFNTRLFLHV